jgi:hypothetical protein
VFVGVRAEARHDPGDPWMRPRRIGGRLGLGDEEPLLSNVVDQDRRMTRCA